MSPKATDGTTIVAGRSGEPDTFRRAAELVDVSEHLYRQLFAAGLWVAVGCTAYAGMSALLQTTHGQLRGAILCAICLPAMIVAAARPAWLYARVRRRPWLLLVPASIMGTCALFTGIQSYQLFVPIVAVIGSIGLAAPARVVVVAGMLGGVCVGAPQVIEGKGDVGGAIALVVPPLMFWLIVDRIAGFALRLHRSLGGVTAPGSRQLVASRVGSVPEEECRPHADAREQRALPVPTCDTVGGKRLTSRQLQVLLLACEGLRHAEIGACLGIGPQQVRRHLRDARERVGVDSTPQLVAWAVSAGLVPRPRP